MVTSSSLLMWLSLFVSLCSPQAIFKDPFRRGGNILVSVGYSSRFTFTLRGHETRARSKRVGKKKGDQKVLLIFFFVFHKKCNSVVFFTSVVCLLGFLLNTTLCRLCATATRHKESQSPLTRGTVLPRSSATLTLWLRRHGMNANSIQLFAAAIQSGVHIYILLWLSSDTVTCLLFLIQQFRILVFS
jgi:hypothetical protein